MKTIAIGFAIGTVAITALVTWFAWPPEDIVALGTLFVLALTLIVLVWYAYDTSSIARITGERWLREGVLNTTYSMDITGEKGDAGRTILQLQNRSALVVRARVACNFRIYGEPIKATDPLYDGESVWLVFPQQFIQGWFEVDLLLQAKGKTVPEMMMERTPANSQTQLTMMLELEFWDELGERRKLPARRHYFDFVRWLWIPKLAE